MTSLQTHTPAVHLPEEDRAAFVMRVYQHVLAAIGAFVAIEALFFMTGVAEGIYNFFSGGKWLLMMGLFMGGQWFVSNAVSVTSSNPSRQYAGLFGSARRLYAVHLSLRFLAHRLRPGQPKIGSTVQAAQSITAIGFAIVEFRCVHHPQRPVVSCDHWSCGVSAAQCCSSLRRRDLFGFEPRRLVLGRR